MSSIFETAPAAARWPGYQHVIFDCDSTLSAIEGIDELSDHPQTRERIVELTNAAMDGRVSLDHVYGERLSLIAPTREAVAELGARYREHMVADAERVVGALLALGREVYIVSGGLLEPVKDFGISLGIPADNIRAVQIEYDQLAADWWRQGPQGADDQGRYLTYRQSALALSTGKTAVIEALLSGKTGASLLIGDGVSDLNARNAVDLFIGFGGVADREAVRNTAPVFIACPTLLPILALALGDPGFFKLDHELRDQALEAIRQSPPHFNRQTLSAHFSRSFL